jgi:hypothetical protein
MSPQVPPACLTRWLHDSPPLRLYERQRCHHYRHHRADDRARTAPRWQAAAARPPAPACRLVPNVRGTDACRHAPVDLHQGVCRYRLRGTTGTGNARGDMGCHLPRHACVFITLSGLKEQLRTGAQPTPSDAHTPPGFLGTPPRQRLMLLAGSRHPPCLDAIPSKTPKRPWLACGASLHPGLK